MSLQKADVERIAHLARLALTEEEAARYSGELSNILDFVRQMEGVDTEGVVPMAHPLDATLRLRPDQVTEADERSLFQSIAPMATEGLYLVPKVIE